MSEDSGAGMLRMVRYKSVLQDADRLRNPDALDRHEILARTIHMGEPTRAKQALLDWLKQQTERLRISTATTVEDVDRVKALYMEMAAKIEGRQVIMATELGYYSQNVAPDFGRERHEFQDWATDRAITRLFEEGNEVIIQGHVGTGKSHLAVLLLERALVVKEPRFVVIDNIAGLRDPTGQHQGRIHAVSQLSEILNIWADLPADTRIVLALDEPESNLRGGASKSVKVFSDFRYMIRKLGMAKVEIWHNQGEQYKALREDDSPHVVRIFKDEKASFHLQEAAKGQVRRRYLEAVPGLQFLAYAHRGMASIDIDVNMQVLIHRLAKITAIPDMKRVVKETLQDPTAYLKGFDAPDPDREEILQAILQNPQDYMGKRGQFDPAKIRAKFDIPWRKAQAIAAEANQKTRPPL